MKYQVKSTCWLNTPLPDWVPGMDRLDWFSPFTPLRDLMEMNIANGGLSRFVVDDDHLEITDTRKILYTVFNTYDSTVSMTDEVLLNGIPEWVETIEIQERPDL